MDLEPGQVIVPVRDASAVRAPVLRARGPAASARRRSRAHVHSRRARRRMSDRPLSVSRRLGRRLEHLATEGRPRAARTPAGARVADLAFVPAQGRRAPAARRVSRRAALGIYRGVSPPTVNGTYRRDRSANRMPTSSSRRSIATLASLGNHEPHPTPRRLQRALTTSISGRGRR